MRFALRIDPVNLATLVSSSVCFVGILFAGVTYFVSSAPGMRDLRGFSTTCTFSALYAACNAALSSSSVTLASLAVRLSMLFMGLLGASWYVYTARREARTLSMLEKALAAGAVLGGALSLVPGVASKETTWVHGVPALGISYLDQPTTTVGNIVNAYWVICGLILAYRAIKRFRGSGWTERAEAVGLVGLLIAGVNDSLASADVVQTPYLLDLAFLNLLILVGTSLAWRSIKNAEAFEVAQHRLVHNERLAAVGEMSAVVAHEVRNPTAVILNAAALLRKNPEDSEKLLGIIDEEAKRLKRLVDDFLDFARPLAPRMVPCELRPMLDNVAEGVRVASGESLIVHVEATLPDVELDSRLVRQALMNLVTNAMQADDRKEPVRVSANRLGSAWVRISVMDDGAGIPAELGERIYQPFFTTRPSGTGLGLPLVQRIARAHGGMLTYESVVGGGTTFNLDLPTIGSARDSAGP